MHKEPEVTVIMPLYNMEKYLPRALDHLLMQDDSDFVLLLVNDGSVDQTQAIAEKYQPRFAHCEIINKPNGGLADARNVGMMHVKTPYFTFHDGDDWVDPGYTKFFRDAFKQHPDCDMVSCGYYIDSPLRKNVVVSKPKRGEISKRDAYLKMTNTFTSPVKGYTWNKGYKLDLVKKHNLQFVKGLAFMEDQIFNVEYVSLTNGFYFDAKPLYHYWQRKDSMVHSVNVKMVGDNVKANYLVWSRIIKSLMEQKPKQTVNRPRKLLTNDRVGKNDRRNQWR